MDGNAPKTAFFSRTYDEACDLVVEARDYLAGPGAVTLDPDAPATALTTCQEELRLTARLTQVMAWLLGQRAVHAGEISAAEAGDRFALGGQKVCLEDDDDLVGLPEPLRDLLTRSRHLYARVARLDERTRGAFEAGPPPADLGTGLQAHRDNHDQRGHDDGGAQP